MDYSRVGFISSTLPGLTVTIDNIRRLKRLWKVYNDHFGENKIYLIVLSKQKRLDVVKTIVQKYSQPGDIAYDPFVRTYTTKRTFMFLPSNRFFILWEKDEDCLQFAMMQLMSFHVNFGTINPTLLEQPSWRIPEVTSSFPR